MFQQINSFNQIPITENSLVVLDIDETIMAFPSITKSWWRETHEKYLAETNDKKKADNLTVHEWRGHVAKARPYLLDESKLKKFLKDIENKSCQLVLLTARDKSMEEITRRHISHCELDITHEQIIHDENKGEALAEIVQSYPEISSIIFVDDFEKNLISVQNRFTHSDLSNYQVQLYQIAHD